MSITINCPCGKILAASDDDAGMPARCPGCGRKHILPGPALEKSAPTLTPEKMKKAERWMLGQESILWRMAALVVVLAVVLGFSWPYLRDYLGLKPDDVVAEDPTNTSDKDDDSPRPRPALPAALDDEAWMTEFDAFAAEVRALARHEFELQERFANKPIRWTVTFAHLSREGGLYFEEAEPLRDDSPAIDVWGVLLPKETGKVVDLEPGTEITIAGTLGAINSARTAEYPMGIIRMGIKNCTVEK